MMSSEFSKKFEIAKKIVEAGNSKIFNNWHENTGISKESFLDGLKWLYEEPSRYPDGHKFAGKLARELGITQDGTLVYLRRVYSVDCPVALYDMETGHAAWRVGVKVSISAADRV